MIWGAAWLFKATKQSNYWNYVLQNMPKLDSGNTNGVSWVGGRFAEFGWDSKHAGINVLVSQVIKYLNFPPSLLIKHIV